MIFVDRNNTIKPNYFTSEEYRKDQLELDKYYSVKAERRTQKTYSNFHFVTKVYPELLKLFNNRCSYCERRISINTMVSNVNVDWFRPKSNARNLNGRLNNEFDSSYDFDHYWWFTHEWENLYLACNDCLINKSNWFPITGKRTSKEMSYKATVYEEEYILLDPCNDRIHDHLSFNLKSCNVVAKTERGEITIDLLRLNNKNLIKERQKALREETSFFKSFLKKEAKRSPSILFSEGNRINQIFNTKLSVPHIGVRKQFLTEKLNKNIEFTRFLISNNIIAENVKNSLNLKELEPRNQADEIQKTNLQNVARGLKRFKIKRIALYNFKCFERFHVQIPETANDTLQAPWLVFLGENGVGKSSILKAIAIALMGQENIDKLHISPRSLLKYGSKQGSIILVGKDESEKFVVKFKQGSDKIISNLKNPPSYLVGYGSTRLLPDLNLENQIKPETNYEFVKTKNLFDYSVSLGDGKKWLLNIDNRITFNKIVQALKQVLLLENEDVIQRSKENETITIRYKSTSKSHYKVENIEDLSDGYRSVIAIVTDIMMTLAKNNIVFENAEGIVLVDEIGTHLHPRWKMEIVTRLRETFPRIQFIVTTHEPLCLRGLKENEIVVLKQKEDEIISIDELPDASGYRVDQLLTSEYFGLNSTVDFSTEKEFNDYYDLLSRFENLNDDEKTRLENHKKNLRKKKHLGNSLREEIVYHVVDKLLAEQVKEKGYKIINDSIKKTAIEKTKEFWLELDKIDGYD